MDRMDTADRMDRMGKLEETRDSHQKLGTVTMFSMDFHRKGSEKIAKNMVTVPSFLVSENGGCP